MTDWREDGRHVMLGLTLTLVFFGAVITIGGMLFLLLSVMAPSSIRSAVQSMSQMIQIGLLLTALAEVIAWNLLPKIGFASERMARHMAILMAGILLFMTMSLLFSL